MKLTYILQDKFTSGKTVAYIKLGIGLPSRPDLEGAPLEDDVTDPAG